MRRLPLDLLLIGVCVALIYALSAAFYAWGEPVRLIHFSNAPVKLGALIARGQKEEGDMKPLGFWVSDEDAEMSWHEWCVSENFRLDLLTHWNEVTLSNNAEILYLKTKQEIVDFGREFVMRDGPFAGGSIVGNHIMFLDWVRVIQRWHGLIITPYVWEARMENDCFWYYGWDCASGCLWDPQAIGSVILREVRDPPAPRYPDES